MGLTTRLPRRYHLSTGREEKAMSSPVFIHDHTNTGSIYEDCVLPDP